MYCVLPSTARTNPLYELLWTSQLFSQIFSGVTFNGHIRYAETEPKNIIKLLMRHDLEKAYRRDQRRTMLLGVTGTLLTLAAIVLILVALNNL